MSIATISYATKNNLNKGSDWFCSFFYTKVPAAPIVFLFGLVLCFIRDTSIFGDLRFGPSRRISLVKIKWEDWMIGFVSAAIPQIPLLRFVSCLGICFPNVRLRLCMFR